MTHDDTKHLARIHCLRRDLNLSDEEYRDLLAAITGQRSAKDLTRAERARVIRRMEELAGSADKLRSKPYKRRPKNTKAKPMLRKIEALLADQSLPWAYADGIAKQMFKVDTVAWCNDEQLRAVVAALHRRQQREREKGGKP